jgi:hypothetical protein
LFNFAILFGGLNVVYAVFEINTILNGDELEEPRVEALGEYDLESFVRALHDVQ